MQLFKKFIAGKLVISVLSFSLLLTQTALARNNTPLIKNSEKTPREGTGGTTSPRGGAVYNSRERIPRKGTGGTTSPRGDFALMLLAPQTHLGATTSVHPTFAWFVREKESRDMEFTLWELDAEGNQKKQIHQEKRKTSVGIMKFSLPDNKPGLTVGQTYRWQVEIIKDDKKDDKSKNLISSNEIEVVKTPANLSSELTTAKDAITKAIIYAKFGMWYDAMSEALAVAPDGKLGEIAAKLVQQLADIDKPKPEGKCENHQQTLQEQQMCVWSKNLSNIALIYK